MRNAFIEPRRCSRMSRSTFRFVRQTTTGDDHALRWDATRVMSHECARDGTVHHKKDGARWRKMAPGAGVPCNSTNHRRTHDKILHKIGAILATLRDRPFLCADSIRPVRSVYRSEFHPCAWGPFASGGAAACAPLVNYNGCVVAGDCTKGGGGESPEGGDLLAAISLTPDGFLRRSTRTARLPLLNLARGLSVARTCGGLLVTAVFTEKEAFAALLASDALTI